MLLPLCCPRIAGSDTDVESHYSWCHLHITSSSPSFAKLELYFGVEFKISRVLVFLFYTQGTKQTVSPHFVFPITTISNSLFKADHISVFIQTAQVNRIKFQVLKMMGNGFDRLERFFSKRKGSATSLASSRTEYSPPSPLERDIPKFPSPSFIRPKGNRMAARDEITLKQISARSASEADILSTMGRSSSRSLKSSDSPDRPKPTSRLAAMRSMSILNQPVQKTAFGLQEYEFPTPPPLRRAPSSPLRSNHGQVPREGRSISPRSRSPLRVPQAYSRSITPPASDQEDEAVLFMKRKLPPLPAKPLPTPDQSPKLSIDSKASQQTGRYEHTDEEPIIGLAPSLLRRPDNDWSLPSSNRETSLSGSTLREPDVQAFLEMTDDEVADDSFLFHKKAAIRNSRLIQLSSMSMSASAAQTQGGSLLTLTPPRVSRAATAAAFETSRIANRWDFDLIYIVNLWPELPSPSQTTAPGDMPAPKPMVGRLLAAYGLQDLCSPLQINAAVHTSILKTEGWIEYSNPDAESNDDLARGYACSFYPGEFPSSKAAHLPVSGVKLSDRIDRGIVFAAYRRPRPGPQKLGTALKKEDLGNLHQEAETLVEMLIDIHAMSRLKRFSSRSRHSDSTGPIPCPKLVMI